LFRPRVIPILTLKGKGLVKTVKFDKKNARYIGDPMNAVRIFNDLDADELIFLDILASQEGRTISPELVKSIGYEAYMPFAVGGGINNLEQIKQLISLGAEKVVINTAAIENLKLLEQASSVFGNQSVVVAIDVKKNFWNKNILYTFGGTKKVTNNLAEYLSQIEAAGAGEILINAIDKDGTMQGYDLEMIKFVSQYVSIPVIACGGAGNHKHLAEAVNIGGASAVAASSMFIYHGERRGILVNYPEKNELMNIFK